MPIDTILTASQLSNLRDAYNPAKMNAALGVTLPAIYPGSQPYMDALGDLFYGGANADLSKSPLSARGRERCLIALLASQGARLNLAVHVYMALMEGVEPNEIAHVLMLVGAYSGVSYFADSLKVAEKTLTELKAVADSGNSGAVDALIALVKAFPT